MWYSWQTSEKKSVGYRLSFNALETACPGIAGRGIDRFGVLVFADNCILQWLRRDPAARWPIVALKPDSSLSSGYLWRFFCLSSYVAKAEDSGTNNWSRSARINGAHLPDHLRSAPQSFGPRLLLYLSGPTRFLSARV